MDAHSIESKLSALRDVLTACSRWKRADNRVARALCELYATRTANELLTAVWPLCPDKIKDARKMVEPGAPCTFSELPDPSDIRDLAPNLLEAVTSHRATDVVKALDAMRVFDLCPPLEQLLDRLEFVTGCVIGRARLIPLVELTTFATEQRAYQRAGRVVAEAHTLAPGPMELHGLLTVEGVLHLSSGNVSKAKECLLESIRVCREHIASLSCNLFGFSTMLAEELLASGEQRAVASFLAECAYVWPHQREHIDHWISTIGAGEKPEFMQSRFLTAVSNPVIKLRTLTARAAYFDDTLSKPPLENGSEMSKAERRLEFQRRTRAALQGKLDAPRN